MHAESLDQTLQKIIAMTSVDPGAEVRAQLLGSANRGEAAVCVLFSGSDFLNSKVLLTERALTLPTHAGQVAFPGGSFDEEDEGDAVRAAFRECEEEVGIPRDLPKAIGVLPAFPTMTGGFVVRPVVATLPELFLNFSFSPDEVTQGEWVSVRTLLATRDYEARSVSGVLIQAPYFMWGDRKMWGLSAWIFDLILNRYDTITE